VISFVHPFMKSKADMLLLGNAFSVQSLNVVIREEDGFKIKETIGVRFVPLTGVTQQ